MIKRPPNWASLELGELCEIARGGSPRPIKSFLTSAHDGINWIKISDATASEKYIFETKEKIKPAGLKKSRLVQPGDFLLSNSMSFGRPYIMRTTGCIHDGWLVLRDRTGALDQDYLYHFLGSRMAFDQFDRLAAGSTVRNLNSDLVRSVAILLPPIGEQRRIAKKLESLGTYGARAREHLDHIPRLVEKYKQAILAAAYSNAREQSEVTELGDISTEVRNGLSKKPSDDPMGFPILRISAVRSLSVRLQDVRYYPTSETIAKASMLRDGDLLFTRYNGNPDFTAVCGMVRGLTCETAYPDKLIRVRLTEAADPGFIELICAAPQSRRWLSPYIKSAAGQHGISGADLKRLPIPLLPVEAQRTVVRSIRGAFNWIDRLAVEAASARKLIDNFDQSVLNRAFRGELVPQDPNDEPASVLLKRIRAEGVAASGQARSGRGRRKREADAA